MHDICFGKSINRVYMEQPEANGTVRPVYVV